jgi:hypothetical protein
MLATNDKKHVRRLSPFALLWAVAIGCGGDGASSPRAERPGDAGGATGREPGGGRPPSAPLDGRMTPPADYDPTKRYDWAAPPADIVVNAIADGASGAVTLPRALERVRDGGVIRVDASLAGAVFRPTSPIVVERSVTIDASQAAGFTIDAEGRDAGIRVGRDLHTVFVGLTIRNVRSSQTGGGLYVDQADGPALGSVKVIGCTFENNQGLAAGGLYVRRRMTAEVRDSVFVKNVALEGTGDDRGKTGGALSARAEGSLTLERVVFRENDAPGAGAVYSIGQPVSVVHGLFFKNGGQAEHGAILVDGGSVLLDGVLVRENQGSGFGGAAQLYGYSAEGDRIVVRRSVFLDNWTTNDKGGAAYMIGAEMEIDSAVFVRNRSKVDAGAIYFPGDGVVRITNSVFGENECTSRSGGGFRKDAGGAVTIARSMFVRNRAGESGGGFWMDPSIDGSLAASILSDNEGGAFVGAKVQNGGENVFWPAPRNPTGPFATSRFEDPQLGPLEEKNGVWFYPVRAGAPPLGVGPSFSETTRRDPVMRAGGAR